MNFKQWRGNQLEVTHYRIESPKLTASVRLVLVADLHSCRYGEGQAELVKVIDAARPDAVLYAGDLFDDRLPFDGTVALLKELKGRYPACYVSGNHEYWSGQIGDMKRILRENAVRVLAGRGLRLRGRSGGWLSICGVDDPAGGGMHRLEQQLARCWEGLDPNRFTLLLIHRPELIRRCLPYGFDLTLSGHAHGGQWRFSFLPQGVVAPGQGLLPAFTGGRRTFGAREQIVSRGLARESTPLVPRIGNRPELVVIDVCPLPDKYE